MARFGGGPTTIRALAGPRFSSGQVPGDDAYKREILYTLTCMQEIRARIDRAELTTVRLGRQSGLSWTDIATSLGVTRQAAWERWHELDDEIGA